MPLAVMAVLKYAGPTWLDVEVPFAVRVVLASVRAFGKRMGSRLVAGASPGLISLGRPSLGVSGIEHMGDASLAFDGKLAPVDHHRVGRRQPRLGFYGGLGAGGDGVS